LLHHFLNLIGAEHRERDHVASRNLGGRRRRLPASHRQPCVLRRINIVTQHAEARRHQPAGQHLTHQAEPYHANRLLHRMTLKPVAKTRCHVSVNARHWQADQGRPLQ